MMRRALAVLALASAATSAFGASADVPYSFKPDTTNLQALQRGARTFMSYCSGCHSLKYLRYNRLGRDLEIPEELLRQHLMFTDAKPGDTIQSSMPGPSGDPAAPSASEQWFGRAPPDLSLTARERGASWIYSYMLTFYLDPSKVNGVNNLVLPGASMPHVLGDLQGWQVKVDAPAGGDTGHGHRGPPLELAQPGSLSPAEYKAFVGDLTNFLVYAAEPGRNRRMALGAWVLSFVVLFGILAYLLKLEYWKDVH